MERVIESESPLADISGDLLDVSWDTITRQAGPHCFDELPPRLPIDLEMSRSPDLIKLVQLVR